MVAVPVTCVLVEATVVSFWIKTIRGVAAREATVAGLLEVQAEFASPGPILFDALSAVPSMFLS